MVQDQVDADYDRARRAFFGGLRARALGGCDHLLSFDEVRRALVANNRFYLGRKVVEVSKIDKSASTPSLLLNRKKPVKAKPTHQTRPGFPKRRVPGR